MKKKISISIAIIICISFINLNAQDSKGFIGIYGGYSMLSGNITKSSDYLDVKQGFAQSGSPLFSLDGAYFFNKHIGAGLLVSMANFGLKDKDVLSAGYVEAFAVDEVTMTIGSYKTLNILPTFYYTLPFDKLSIDFRLMVGYSSLTTPEIKVQLEDAAETPLIQEASTGGGLGFGVGAGLRYNFIKKLGVALRVDYLNAKPSVDVKYTNLNNPTAGLFRNETKYNESIGSLNASLGIFYSFGSK